MQSKTPAFRHTRPMLVSCSWRTPSKSYIPTMSGTPAPSSPPGAEERPLYRLAEELTPSDLADMDEAIEVDLEEYLRWLETGEGTDPCERAFSR